MKNYTTTKLKGIAIGYFIQLFQNRNRKDAAKLLQGLTDNNQREGTLRRRGEKLALMAEAVEMQVDGEVESSKPNTVVHLLRRFLAVQENRAAIYSRLRRGFEEYLRTGADLPYQQLCSEITAEFNDCSKQVLEMESILGGSDHCREDLASLLKTVQTHEKQKLHMTAMIQILKKAGRPSERLVTHERCRFTNRPFEHQCVHVHEITEATGLEDAEADAEYDAALNEAIRAVQEAVTCINDQMEEVRYEIEELESKEQPQN